MSSMRKLMGRLNATTVRYDIGRGGVPELTQQDIAGAVGMIKDALARSVFCLLWWPDGANLTRDRVMAELRGRVWDEQGRRAMEWNKANLAACQLREECKLARPTPEQQRLLCMAESRADRAKASTWPGTIATYPLLVQSVVDEIGSNRRCPACGGRETVPSPTGPKNCERCGTTGKVPHTNVDRAHALRVSESTYRKVWSQPYEWTFSMIADLELEASAHMKAAIGTRE